ncbi:MAG: Peptidase [Cyanobacteria bacterium RYN_339]|nr:Peptidase [Cyanobacteria bacterium RYN_339]
MQPATTTRKLGAALVAACLGITLVPAGAHAAWKGLRAFDCQSSRANWNFDGLYGPYTLRSIRRFQAAHKIKVDGIAGPETYKALGLKYRRSLKCGMGGNDIFLLQQTLASAGYWYGSEAPIKPPSAKPTTKPSAKPSAKPTPAFTAPPVIMTPEPMRTQKPTPMPTAKATPAPAAKPEAAPENRPTVEIKGGNWMVPLNAGSTNYDYTFSRPTWLGEADLWLGDVGLGADVTDFNQTFTNYRTTQYFGANTMMYDGLLKYRFDHGYYQVFGGYRGIGLGDVNFGTVGVGMSRPLVGNWLWLNAKAQGGHNFASSYFLDGEAGLGLRVSVLELDLGFRHFAFQNSADPLFNMNGPEANVKLAF